MRTKEAVQKTINYLANNIPYAVRTSMQENENPRPVVVLDEWTRDDDEYHNTSRRGVLVDDQGNITDAVFHHYYDLRLDFKIRAGSEGTVYDVKNAFEDEVLYLHENPFELDDQINKVRYRDETGVTPHHDLDNSEGTLSAGMEIKSFRRRLEEVDVLETIDSETNVIN